MEANNLMQEGVIQNFFGKAFFENRQGQLHVRLHDPQGKEEEISATHIFGLQPLPNKISSQEFASLITKHKWRMTQTTGGKVLHASLSLLGGMKHTPPYSATKMPEGSLMTADRGYERGTGGGPTLKVKAGNEVIEFTENPVQFEYQSGNRFSANEDPKILREEFMKFFDQRTKSLPKRIEEMARILSEVMAKMYELDRNRPPENKIFTLEVATLWRYRLFQRYIEQNGSPGSEITEEAIQRFDRSAGELGQYEKSRFKALSEYGVSGEWGREIFLELGRQPSLVIHDFQMAIEAGYLDASGKLTFLYEMSDQHVKNQIPSGRLYMLFPNHKEITHQQMEQPIASVKPMPTQHNITVLNDASQRSPQKLEKSRSRAEVKNLKRQYEDYYEQLFSSLLEAKFPIPELGIIRPSARVDISELSRLLRYNPILRLIQTIREGLKVTHLNMTNLYLEATHKCFGIEQKSKSEIKQQMLQGYIRDLIRAIIESENTRVHLKKLSLPAEVMLSDQILTDLSELLQYGSLEEFSLAKCSLAKSERRTHRRFCSYERVDFSEHRVPDGWRALINALRTCTIKSIDLSGNELSDEMGAELLRALNANPNLSSSLYRIRLDNNQLGELSAVELEKLILECPLVYVDISKNHIVGRHLAKIIIALKNKGIIQSFFYRDNLIVDDERGACCWFSPDWLFNRKGQVVQASYGVSPEHESTIRQMLQLNKESKKIFQSLLNTSLTMGENEINMQRMQRKAEDMMRKEKAKEKQLAIEAKKMTEPQNQTINVSVNTANVSSSPEKPTKQDPTPAPVERKQKAEEQMPSIPRVEEKESQPSEPKPEPVEKEGQPSEPKGNEPKPNRSDAESID